MTLDYEVYKEGGLLRDRYKLIEDISEGSYGYVSLASDTKLKKLVAVKYIFKNDEPEQKNDCEGVNGEPQDDGRNLTANSSIEKKQRMLKHQKSLISDKVLSRFSNNVCFEALYEVEIQTKIGKHKNITELYDFFDSYIIMEYCSGGDLYEVIKADLAPRKTKNITSIISQILDAVEYVHSRGIYHRDIKPENILISGNWNVKLTDWGLATTEQTSMERNVGSERYMAPELFESNLDREEKLESYDCSKVDIWAIGIVMLNIVFHKNPFTVANQSDKAFCYFAANREALFDVFSTMSYDFFQVLRHSLTIDPANRNLENVKAELSRLGEYTMDDEYYNSLHSDEEMDYYPPPIIPPKSAPSSVSLSSIAPMSPLKTTAPATVATTMSDVILNAPPVVASVKEQPSNVPVITLKQITPEQSREKDKATARFTFTKRSHPRSKSNDHQQNKNNNKNAFQRSEFPYQTNKNKKSNIKPIKIQNNDKIIKNSRKPLAIPTPNTHINNFFQEYQANEPTAGFNTRDYFTPPSVHNRYMDGVFSKKNGKQMGWTNSPKNPNGNNGTFNRRDSYHQDNSKYIPPHSRKSFNAHSPTTLHLSPSYHDKPPLNTTTYHEQHALNVDNEPDLDDVLFTLEETDGFDGFVNDMSDLSLNTQRSATPLENSNKNANLHGNNSPDLPDLLSSHQISQVNLNDNLQNHVTLHHSSRKLNAAPEKGKSGVYVPPHHRKSFNNGQDTILSVQNGSYSVNTIKRHSFGNRRTSHLSSSQVKDRTLHNQGPYRPNTTGNGYPQTNEVSDNHAIYFEDDEPHFFSMTKINSPKKIRTGRKSSTKQDEMVGSLEQYKNNWLMLQQYQD